MKSWIPVLLTVLAISTANAQTRAMPIAFGGTGIQLLLNFDPSGPESKPETKSDLTGEMTLDCAHGSIQQAYINGAGDFVATGEMILEHGGPSRSDERSHPLKAHFLGFVRTNAMTLLIYNEKYPDQLATYQLVRDGRPILRRCL